MTKLIKDTPQEKVWSGGTIERYDENGTLRFKKSHFDHIYKWNKNGNLIYKENALGNWWKYKYNKNRNKIYEEHSDGKWWKREYDEEGNRIYMEDSDGNWWKYDENGNIIDKRYKIK